MFNFATEQEVVDHCSRIGRSAFPIIWSQLHVLTQKTVNMVPRDIRPEYDYYHGGQPGQAGGVGGMPSQVINITSPKDDKKQ